MDGRNGLDECGKVVIVSSFSVYMLAVILRSEILQLLSMCLLGYGLFRVFSKDRNKRLEENHKFLSYLQLIKMNFEQRRTHRIFICKRCGKKVRVPKGKGKIEIVCPLCGNKMIHRT